MPHPTAVEHDGRPGSVQSAPVGAAAWFMGAMFQVLLLALGSSQALAQCPPLWITSPPIIDFTSSWKYHPNTNGLTTEPSDGWAQPDFNDSDWSEGPGLFGSETHPEIYRSFGPFQTHIAPPWQGPISSYFRKRFHWNGSSSAPYLNFTNLADDGLIVYLNGMELFSFNMPAAPRPMTWDGLALATDRLGEGIPFTTNIFVPDLRIGENLLAVELHQSGISSGDDVFGMKMTATTGHFDPVQPTQPTNQSVLGPATVTLVAESFGDPGAQFQWYEEGTPIAGATAAVYSFAHTNACDAHEPAHFFCEVQGALCTYRTRTATIEFLRNDDPPFIRSVWSGSGSTDLYVEFDEALQRDSAENVFAYFISDSTAGEFAVLSAQLLADQRTVMLTLESTLSPGTTYTLGLFDGGVKNLCGIPANEANVPFQLRTRDVPLHVARVSPGFVRLDWADASFHLESAISPLGPWISNPFARSGDLISMENSPRFFRLHWIPE